MSKQYIPHVSRNPLRLALSLLFSDNPSARSALWMAAAGLACLPLDLVLSVFERRRLAGAAAPEKPVFLVCGPPRSGTTLVAQYLINSLDVAYLNNLTSIFPRSPLTVNRIWGAASIRRTGNYSAFYGKSRGLGGVNDALYVWDRWLGDDRTAVPAKLADGAERDMPAFFAELERLYGKAVVNKVNRLNTCAHLVAEVLPEACFLIVEREPLWLAQSLYIARKRIAGDMSKAYGTQHPDSIPDDPVADVCAQVRFHAEATSKTLARLPPGRAIRVPYEAFCARPAGLIERLHESVGERMPPLREAAAMQPAAFDISREPKLPGDVLARMAELLATSVPSGR